MIRTSSVRRRLAAAAGVLLATAALSACGTGPAHQGSAAVVGGERISIATVEARVGAVRTAAAAQQGGGAEPAGLSRRMVHELVLDKVVDRALADHQLEVTAGEIAQAREADGKLLGGEDGLVRALVLKQYVPAGEIDAFYHQQLGIQKLATAAGKDSRTADGVAAIRSALATAGEELSIQVNPRYGSWDSKQISLVDSADAWLPQPAASA
ncbi:SurA N-terminal domain-containing protein [Kitasatospora sp. NPDC002227]|uniref:SurA N-terminal domain-containing protein n=1 Tax=Kitasatospora sp. NPDC002227 TaxID=3154773 RepID=UPI003331BB1C